MKDNAGSNKDKTEAVPAQGRTAAGLPSGREEAGAWFVPYVRERLIIDKGSLYF